MAVYTQGTGTGAELSKIISSSTGSVVPSSHSSTTCFGHELSPEAAPRTSTTSSSLRPSTRKNSKSGRLSDNVRIALLLVVWWTASVLLGLEMKTILGPGGLFPYGILVTGLTNIVTGLSAWVLTKCSSRIPPVPAMTAREVGILLLFGTLQSVEYGFSNKSLETLSISGRTMLSSSNSVLMLITARLWGLEIIDSWRLVSVALGAFGIMLQGVNIESYGDSSRSTSYGQGVAFLLISVVCSCQKTALLQHILQQADPGSALSVMADSKLHLISRVQPVAGVICFCFATSGEMERASLSQLLNLSLIVRIVAIAFGIVILACAEYEFVRLTSGLALQIFANLHGIPVAIVGALVFRESIRPLNAVGFLVCLAGALAYVKARTAGQEQSESDGLLRDEMDEENEDGNEETHDLDDFEDDGYDSEMTRRRLMEYQSPTLPASSATAQSYP